MLVAAAMFVGLGTGAVAQNNAPAGGKFEAGLPLGVAAAGKHQAMSSNVKVFGAIVSAESCIYDATRKLIMVINRGAAQTEAPNDGFVSLLNHDGSVHTAKWIGATRTGLTLNQPFGSDIHAGKLYLADSDGGTADGAPRVSVIRMFDVATGAPSGEIRVPASQWFNDIAVASDGVVYATQSGFDQAPMRIYRVTSDGPAKVIVEGAPLAIPNGIAVDGDGNLVVVNMDNRDVLTFSPEGKLLKTETAAQAGNDGLVTMSDGTKYVSSVREGGIQRLRKGRPAELIATGIPSAASMCFDPDAKQLVVPMNPNNAVALVKL
jgi:DNA-binding beta-propeller fold protein YncE